MKGFLIAPVRGYEPDHFKKIIEKLEASGIEMYWPARDTDQSDPDGYDICRQNATAIASADIIYVIWDGKSQGCLFDLGIAFALGKRVVSMEMPPPTEGKSFQNMIRVWEYKSFHDHKDNNILNWFTVLLRHAVRKTVYRIAGNARVQCPKDKPLQDDEMVLLYQDVNSFGYSVRRAEEFFEPGRFEVLEEHEVRSHYGYTAIAQAEQHATERAVQFVEKGHFLHDTTPPALFARECGAKMRKQLLGIRVPNRHPSLGELINLLNELKEATDLALDRSIAGNRSVGRQILQAHSNANEMIKRLKGPSQ
jgi:hypothetical protein